mmetsp:Transcript_48008/g.109007  ORF Transcript_48008/g.109007 Transcript_48008/m.109007 type:complete len:359 (+) Transcript_48008:139-1215(+)
MMRTLLCASSMAGVRTAHHGLSASAESQDEVSAAPTAQSGGKPILRLGVIADIQHCNIPDGTNFAKTISRKYRGSLAMLDRATDYWNDQKVDLVLQLGDIIDGKCRIQTDSETDLASVLSKLSRSNPALGFVHLIGNHELYNFNRAQLRERLDTARGGGHPQGTVREFYHLRPVKGLRLVVLDPYFDSVIEKDPENSDGWARGAKILQANNPNMTPEAMQRGAGWFDGMQGPARRFVPFNGGYGAEQLGWLEKELDEAVRSGERVVVLSHVILHPEACDGTTMAWDYEAALEVIAKAPKGTVPLVLAGHDHQVDHKIKSNHASRRARTPAAYSPPLSFSLALLLPMMMMRPRVFFPGS